MRCLEFHALSGAADDESKRPSRRPVAGYELAQDPKILSIAFAASRFIAGVTCE